MRRHIRNFMLLAAALLVISSCGGSGDAPSTRNASPRNVTVTIAAANNLHVVMDELIAEFERLNPEIDIAIAFGSSGKLFAQIANGAPFDIFLSADTFYPRQLRERGHVTLHEPFAYADGRLVVLAIKNTGLESRLDGLLVLRDKAVSRIAIANPRVAPYGRAAIEVLQYAGGHDEVLDRLVLAENVSQVLQFVESGGAQVGLVPLSLVRNPALAEKAMWWEIPEFMHSRIQQSGIILDHAAHPVAAERFVEFLLGPEAKRIFESNGYRVV